jgi:hypothetical protein
MLECSDTHNRYALLPDMLMFTVTEHFTFTQCLKLVNLEEYVCDSPLVHPPVFAYSRVHLIYSISKV